MDSNDFKGLDNAAFEKDDEIKESTHENKQTSTHTNDNDKVNDFEEIQFDKPRVLARNDTKNDYNITNDNKDENAKTTVEDMGSIKIKVNNVIIEPKLMTETKNSKTTEGQNLKSDKDNDFNLNSVKVDDLLVRNDAIDINKSNNDVNGIVFEDINNINAKSVYKTDTEGHNEIGEPIVRYKGVFSSFNEKTARKCIRQYSFRETAALEDNLKESVPELNRSQYSLVSCGELSPEAVQLWLGLPEEVKYDPALAAFRQLYEKEHGKDHSIRNGTKHRPRLPLVSSAPHLNNNLHTVAEDVVFDFKPEDKKEDNCLDNTTQHKNGKLAMAGHLVKMTLLLGCWVFFTVVFLMYNEKEEIVMNSAIVPGEVKSYNLNTQTNKLSIRLDLTGPFLSEQSEAKLNSSEWRDNQKMEVWLENGDGSTNGSFVEASKPWTILLQENSDLDFNRGESRSSVLTLSSNSSNTRNHTIRLRTSTNETVPFRLSYALDPIDLSTGVIYSCVLLCGLYVLIIFEFINRTMAAVIVSTTSLAALALAGQRPTVEEVVSWLDVETLLLLFSMMLLVAIMAETGMFDFLAVATFEVTKGKLWPLITVLCAITALLSTFLDNVTTVLLMTPVTIRLCEVMDLDPIPILMSMVLYSNIGGTATPVGDPPNVIIASNKAVIQAGINFANFTLHMTIGIIFVALQTYVQLRFMFRDTNKLRLNVPRDIQDVRHQIAIWRRAADSLPHLSKDQHIVRERLERKVTKLTAQLHTLVKESNKRACPKETFKTTLQDMKEKYKIRDKALLIKASFALSFVVTVFFLHSIPELNRVSLGWTALLGAILLLILADREDLEPILHRVEWSTLLFFAALFVLMEALSKLGLIEFIGGLTENLILKVDESARLAVSLLLMLWVSGISSAFVDNIPLTTMMVRVVTSLGSNPNLNLPMAPLIWALSFGACLGGNGTLIGASANVVCAGVAEQHGYKFTFVQFFKIGFPVMIGHLIVASGYLLLCHCVFEWH